MVAVIAHIERGSFDVPDTQDSQIHAKADAILRNKDNKVAVKTQDQKNDDLRAKKSAKVK